MLCAAGCCCASEAFATGNWNSGVCICICERLQGGAVLLAIRGLSKGREGKNGLRHRALWSRPTLGRHTSGTGHGDGDNDAGIGISSSFEHHIRICDHEQQRLKLDHAKATFRTTTTSQETHKRRVPQCLRRPQDANLAEVPRPAERAGCTIQSAKRRQRARRCMDMLALALRRRDHSKGLGSHQPP